MGCEPTRQAVLPMLGCALNLAPPAEKGADWQRSAAQGEAAEACASHMRACWGLPGSGPKERPHGASTPAHRTVYHGRGRGERAGLSVSQFKLIDPMRRTLIEGVYSTLLYSLSSWLAAASWVGLPSGRLVVSRGRDDGGREKTEATVERANASFFGV